MYASGSYRRALGDTPEDVLRCMIELTGGELVTLTGGEHRPYEDKWVVPLTRQIFNTVAPLPLALSGERYGHFLARQMLGHVLYPFIVRNIKRGKLPYLPHDTWAREDGQIIRAATEATGSNMPPMRGVPTATAFSFFSGLPGSKKRFERRVELAVQNILNNDPSTIIQFELPAELAFTSMGLSDRQRVETARRMAASIERIVRELPKGSRIAFHLCWGDLRRRPFVQKWMQRNANKVLLINALLELGVWREGWNLFAVHDPFCDGRNLPSLNRAEYDAYDGLLQFPDDTIYAVGALHHQFDAESTAEMARLLETKLTGKGVRQLALAPPCGDGRKPLEEVLGQWRIAREALALLNS